MRVKLLQRLAHFHVNHPFKMLSVVLLGTIVFGFFAIQIKHTMRWSDLLPEKDPRTIEFNKVIDEFSSATSIVVVVQGEEEDIKKFADKAETLIKDQIDPKDNQKYFRRIDYKLEKDFIKKHGLMLIKEDDLKNLKDVFTNPNLVPLITNINNSFEKEYIERDESLSTREKEDSAYKFLDGIEYFVNVFTEFVEGKTTSKQKAVKSVDKIIYGEEYMLSYDKSAVVLNVIPNFTMVDLKKLMPGTRIVQGIVDQLEIEYPDVEAGLTGMIPIQHDEMVSTEQSLGYTSVFAFIAIFILLVVAFRMVVAPLFGILNLIIGVIWAVGLTSITIGTLNMMTSMMGIILIGLGIDFSIHIISGFTEHRAQGIDIEQSLMQTFLKSGKGVITGAMTTSVAFLTLIVCRTRGMQELGIVLGLGLIAVMVVTFICLPALLVIRERYREKRLKRNSKTRDISFKSLGVIAKILGRYSTYTIIGAILSTLILGYFAFNITFDQNYLNMEPIGLESVHLQDVVLDKFDLSMDYGLILTDTVEESRELREVLKEKSSVASTEDISSYLPSKEEQSKRIPYILDIRKKLKSSKISKTLSKIEVKKLIKELKRLEMNVMELQDMSYLGGQDKVDTKCSNIVGTPDNSDSKNIIRGLINSIESNVDARHGVRNVGAGPRARPIELFQRYFSPYFKDAVLNMANTDFIEFEDLPVSILDRYSNTARNKFLVTVFPTTNIWQDLEFLDRFSDDLESCSDKATGMPVVFRALIEIIGQDGRLALMLTFIIVFILLWIDFRSLRDGVIAMIPLVAGLLWMVGIMKIAGMQITIMNVLGLPLIVGIGIDDGVHIVHRWKYEGGGNLYRIFASTGKAIMLTSLTTMLAFGSLYFSIWRGFASLGNAMFIGVGACFLSTIIILSALIAKVDKRSITNLKEDVFHRSN